MWDLLKDWRGWLADWELYTADAVGIGAFIWAVVHGDAVGAALTAGFLILLIVYSVVKDSRR